MPAERYFRWHNSSAGRDEEQNGFPELEEEFEEEVPAEGQPSNSRVMTVTPRRAARFNAARRSSAPLPFRVLERLDMSYRTLAMLAVSCALCLILGFLVGHSIPTHHHDALVYPPFSSQPPLAPQPSTSTLPRFGGRDYQQTIAVSFQSHLNSRMVNAYASRLDRIADSQLVDYVSSTLSFQGFVTKTTFFSASISIPDAKNPNTVELVHSNRSNTVINQPSLENNRLPFAAFSPASSATGRVVYGHRGSVKDLAILQKMDVQVKGNILLLRHCSDSEAAQVLRAQAAGAVGVLLYPDPQQFKGNGSQYPSGSGLPGNGVLFPNVKVVPGDPTTLHYPSLGHVYKKSLRDEDDIMPKIPAQPISYSTAKIILAALAGPEIPAEWKSDQDLDSLSTNSSQQYPTPSVVGPPWHKVGGEWAKDSDIVAVSLKVFNQVRETGISNVHAWLPARDPSKVVHIGASLGSRGGAGVGLASLLAIGESMARTLTGGTGRRVMLSAWAESNHGWIGSTEFTELNAEWLESTALAYLSVGDTVSSSLGLRVQATPLLHEAVREAAHTVSWPKQEALSVLEGWRAGHGLEYDIAFENLGCGGDAMSFASRLGVPAAQFSVAKPVHPGQCREGDCDPCYDRREEHPLAHSQYDTTEATIQVLDPSLDWTTAMASLIGVTSLVLSESVLPPVDFKGDFSGSLVDGWWSFLHHHVHSLNSTEHNFTEIVDAIRVELYSLQSQMEEVDRWYNKLSNQDDPYASFRHDEDRVSYFLRQGRRLLGPRGIQRVFTSALVGPSVLIEDPFHALHDDDDRKEDSEGVPSNILTIQTNNVFSQSQFNKLDFSSSYREEDKPRPHSWYPQVSQALTLALEGKGTWENLHMELSLVLSALTAFRSLIPLEN